MSTITDKKRTDGFKTFPEFSKLTLADRPRYDAFIAQYPPVSDIQFTSLMLWWNPLSSLAAAELNGNLVISYWLPGDDQLSGLSVVGTNQIDETICTVLDYLQEQGEPPRLVHVPEFVMGYMRHPELFSFEGERAMDEYVIPVSRLYPLQHLVGFRRSNVGRFLARVDERTVVTRSVDLAFAANQRLLLNSVAKWPTKGTLNELTALSNEVLSTAITEADRHGMENACLYVDGRLHAYMLYHLPPDKRYAIFCHAKFSYELPHLFDYAVYAFARWFAERGITHINLDADYNVPMLRTVKLALGPANYFRKYTVGPAAAKL